MSIYLGYSQTVITPDLDRPVYLAGFSRDRRATAVHDDLTARALCLRTDRLVLVLVALDLIGFFRADVLEVVERVRARVGPDTPPVEMLIASTHTHHGPDTMGLWGPSELERGVDPVYMAQLKDRIVDATLAAVAGAVQPVVLQHGARVRVPGVARNARDPEIVDDELALLQFIGPDGRPLATLADFPCHPEVLWDGNPVITADYAGVLRREIEAATGAPCLFLAGALGGMMTPDVVDHSFEACEAMGKVLARAGLEALDGPAGAPGHRPQTSPARSLPATAGPISICRAPVSVRVQNPLFEMAFAAGILPDGRNDAGEVETAVSLVKLGGFWLAGVPGELFPKPGMALKADMLAGGAEDAAIIGLADDELGYILPAEDYVTPADWLDPGDQYEESVCVSQEAGPRVVAAVRSLL